jgi:hypothetical protein
MAFPPAGNFFGMAFAIFLTSGVKCHLPLAIQNGGGLTPCLTLPLSMPLFSLKHDSIDLK